MNRALKLRLSAVAVWLMCALLQSCTPAAAAVAVTPLDPMTITAVGPLTIINLDATFFGMPLTLGAGGTYQSPPTKANGYATVAVHVTSTQAGTLSIQRYLDDGTLQIPQGAAVTVALVANTINSVSIANDGLPWDSFSYTITNSGGSTATLSQFKAKLHSGGVAKSGSTAPNVSSATGILPVANGGTGVTTAQGNGTFIGPNPIAGATAEYPFTEGTGTVVNDISGNANTANFGSGGNAPTWTTWGAAFAGTNTYITTPLTTFKTVIAHICPTTALGTGTGYSFWISASGVPATTGLGISAGVSSLLTPYNSVSGSIWRWSSGSFISSATIGVPLQPCSVVAVTLGTSDHIYLNGSEVTYTSQGASSAGATISGGGTYLLGSSSANSVVGFVGNISYAVFYSTALTSAQVASESQYVASKVTSRSGYPGYAPQPRNTNSTSVIGCGGDSLTFGVGGSAWCNATYITPLTNTYSFNLDGIGGRTAHDYQGVFQATSVPGLAANAGRNIEHIWVGTNDCVAGYTAAQMWNSLQNLGLEVIKAGATPVVATMLSRTGQDTCKNALNALIRANYKTVFAALDDLAAVPGLGADGAYANPTVSCFSDGTHLKNTGTCYNSLSGYPVVGWNVARLINILDGTTASNPTVTTSNAYTQAIADNYVLQTPTAAATDALPDCTGLTGIQRTINNGSASFAITVSSAASLSITGSTTIAANGSGTFTCMLTGPTTGGNYWLRTN